MNPAAPHTLPVFVTPPGSTDVLMVVAIVTLIAVVLLAGVCFLHLHSLPERLAHKGQKLQMELVAVLCLLALFTHVHLFWVAALLLAFIDIPNFVSPLNRMADAAEVLAGLPPRPRPDEPPRDDPPRNEAPTGNAADVAALPATPAREAGHA